MNASGQQARKWEYKNRDKKKCDDRPPATKIQRQGGVGGS
jgi:hypothetical protein